MEEMLGNPAGCRQVFERWMEWEPEEQAWHSYINFELRYKEVDKARTIYERYILLGMCVCVDSWRGGLSRPLRRNLFLNSAILVMVHPEVKNWIKYARFEERHGYIAHSRKVYERAVEFFGEDHIEENLFVAFSKFEEAQKEVREVECPPGAASGRDGSKSLTNSLLLRSSNVLV